MKFIPAIISVLFINLASAQEKQVKYYSLSELKNAVVDSVIAVDLKKMNLSELPPELMRFKHIQYLDLSKNKFSNVTGLENFPHLRYLNLEKNRLDYFPVSICQLTEIETLILNRNYFESIPACIEYCQQLKTIDLWYTSVTTLPQEITRIPSLEAIDLTGIQINKERQEQLKQMLPRVKLTLSPPCNCTH